MDETIRLGIELYETLKKINKEDREREINILKDNFNTNKDKDKLNDILKIVNKYS